MYVTLYTHTIMYVCVHVYVLCNVYMYTCTIICIPFTVTPPCVHVHVLRNHYFIYKKHVTSRHVTFCHVEVPVPYMYTYMCTCTVTVPVHIHACVVSKKWGRHKSIFFDLIFETLHHTLHTALWLWLCASNPSITGEGMNTVEIEFAILTVKKKIKNFRHGNHSAHFRQELLGENPKKIRKFFSSKKNTLKMNKYLSAPLQCRKHRKYRIRI